MEALRQQSRSKDMASVALKAFDRIATRWDLTIAQAAALADMSESTWKRARKPANSVDLTHDQLLRLSAIIGIYKSLELYFGEEIARTWPALANLGPLFHGATPIETMIDQGLPQFLQVRNYLDALRGGM